jgi:RNA polymerase sigma-70 factor (ECF subfamily)
VADEWLAEQFDAHRARLQAVAYRMLGTTGDADDAVQEAWMRLSRTPRDRADNLGGWLTTVVARVALDMLRARGRREAVVARHHRVAPPPAIQTPEDEMVLADSVGAALLVVLDALTPAERLAFVLHDMFDVPFDDIASVLGRSTPATKMLASRARHKVQGSGGRTPETDVVRQREIVDAFLAASRSGDFDTLVSLLHPDVVLTADTAAVDMGSPAELRGARSVASMFAGRALAAQAAVIDGAVGVVWAVGGHPRVAWDFVIREGQIVHIDMLAASDSLDGVDLDLLDD